MNTINSFLPKKAQDFLEAVALTACLLSNTGCVDTINVKSQEGEEKKGEIVERKTESKYVFKLRTETMRPEEVENLCPLVSIDSTNKYVYIRKECAKRLARSINSHYRANEEQDNKDIGIKSHTEQLIKNAQADYKETHPQFKVIVQ